MRIVDLRKVARPGGARVAATVIWEECDRPTQEVYVECRGPAAEDLAPNPDAFLLACVMPAMEYRERRVQIEGTICPELRNGLGGAFGVICDWFPENKRPTIEASGGVRPTVPRTPSRVASFMSAGIDALATLRCNRLDYPLDHPASIQDCFFLFGFNTYDFSASGPVAERLDDFERRVARMENLAREARINLIPVYTNVRFIAKDFDSWNRRGMGAGLASVAHAFSARISRALIGSSGLQGVSPPSGTHPLVDPNYSSAGLEIRQDGLWLSRLEKTAIVGDWDAALAIVQCCQQHELQDTINCGQCNKCFRTMIHLAALGKLERAHAFPSRAVTPEMIHQAEVSKKIDATYLEQTVELFMSVNRPDLAQAVRDRVARYREREKQVPRRVWWGAVKQCDSRWTGGILTRLVRRLR